MQATSENIPSCGSERCWRHISAEGKGNCRVPDIARVPLKMRCIASWSVGSVRRTVTSMYVLPLCCEDTRGDPADDWSPL